MCLGPRPGAGSGTRAQRSVRAPGDDHGRTGQEHVPGVVARDLELTAGYVDPPAARSVTGRRDGRGAGTGAARPGLAGAALVDAHRDVVGPAAYDELDVHAPGIELLVVRRLLAQRPGLGQVVDHHDRVRVADVDMDRRPRPVGHRHLGLAEDPRDAHVGGPDVAVAGHGLHAGARRDPDRLVGGHQALLVQVAGEDPDAVAAHLRDRAVGVAVVHEPLGGGLWLSRRALDGPPRPAGSTRRPATRCG